MLLPSSLVNVGERVVDFFERGGDAPYLLCVYKPSEEYAVRRDLGELRLWLEAKQVNCVPISLADLFWQALEESRWLEPLLEEERRAQGDSATLGRVIESVGEVLREPPTLPDRVVAALNGCEPRGVRGVSRGHRPGPRAAREKSGGSIVATEILETKGFAAEGMTARARACPRLRSLNAPWAWASARRDSARFEREHALPSQRVCSFLEPAET